MSNELYFAYGSNMNLNQMAFRCPDAEVIESVQVEGYRLAFRGGGVATILPEEGSRVEGVLWRVSADDERSLDRYEGLSETLWKGGNQGAAARWRPDQHDGLLHELSICRASGDAVERLSGGNFGGLQAKWN